jgi:hypothetical protein
VQPGYVRRRPRWPKLLSAVGSFGVVVRAVFVQPRHEVALTEDEYSIGKLRSDCAYESFGVPVGSCCRLHPVRTIRLVKDRPFRQIKALPVSGQLGRVVVAKAAAGLFGGDVREAVGCRSGATRRRLDRLHHDADHVLVFRRDTHQPKALESEQSRSVIHARGLFCRLRENNQHVEAGHELHLRRDTPLKCVEPRYVEFHITGSVGAGS